MTWCKDGMVVEAGGAALWGWGGPGATVEARLEGKVLTRTKVDQRGIWRASVRLPPGGPYNISLRYSISSNPAQCSRNQKSVQDTRYKLAMPSELWLSVEPGRASLTVLAGRVWLCAGSDRMAAPLAGLANSSAEIGASLNLTQLRSAAVRPAWTEEPQLELVAGFRDTAP